MWGASFTLYPNSLQLKDRYTKGGIGRNIKGASQVNIAYTKGARVVGLRKSLSGVESKNDGWPLVTTIHIWEEWSNYLLYMGIVAYVVHNSKDKCP